MKNNVILNLLFLIFVNVTYSQKLEVSGKVVNSVTGTPIENANIFFENSGFGTATNISGAFFIKSEIKNRCLLISCVGFETARIIIHNSIHDTLIKLLPVSYNMQVVKVYSKTDDCAGINTTLQQEQIKLFSGLSKDILRCVQLLPGVSSDNEVNSIVNVRGGTPDENLILINGVETHNPFHLKEYPITGAGIFNIGMVKKIDFSAGGFSSRYGGALSSLLNIEYNPGSCEKISCSADLSMIDANIILEGPVNNYGSFVLGFRKSFVNRLLNLLSSHDNLPYMSFYDIQSQFDYNFSPVNKIKINFIYAKDDFKDYPHTDKYGSFDRAVIFSQSADRFTGFNEYTFSNFNSYNILAGLNSTNILSDNLSSETIASFYRENESRIFYMNKSGDAKYAGYPEIFLFSTENNNLSDKLKTDYFSFSNHFSWYLNKYYSINIGGEIRKILYSRKTMLNGLTSIKTNSNSYPDTSVFCLPRNPIYNDTSNTIMPLLNMNGYLENIIKFPSGLSIKIGGRVDYFGWNKSTNFSPRINISFAAGLRTIINSAWGYYYQMPPYIMMGEVINASNLNRRNPKAEHFIIGLENNFSNSFKLKTEFYYKKYSNLILAERLYDGSINYEYGQNTGNGYAKGMDIQIIARLNDFNCTIGYGYLTAKEKLNGPGQTYYPRYTAQSHTLSGNLNCKFNNVWNVNINIFYGSGYAFTARYLTQGKTGSGYIWVNGSKNSSHFPAYFRVDLRISKQQKLFGNPITFYLNIMNVLNKRNVYAYRYVCKNETGEPVIEAQKLLPVIPALGITYEIE